MKKKKNKRLTDRKMKSHTLYATPAIITIITIMSTHGIMRSNEKNE